MFIVPIPICGGSAGLVGIIVNAFIVLTVVRWWIQDRADAGQAGQPILAASWIEAPFSWWERLLQRLWPQPLSLIARRLSYLCLLLLLGQLLNTLPRVGGM